MIAGRGNQQGKTGDETDGVNFYNNGNVHFADAQTGNYYIGD